MKLISNIGKWFYELYDVWRREFHIVFSDVGVLLFFFGLPLFYPIVYTLIYNPEVVDSIPVVVVDHSRTAESRTLARTINDTPEIDIIGYANDLSDARTAMNEKKCYGILEIPDDYARKIGNGEQAVVAWYDEMSLLLRYRAFLTALTNVQLELGSRITAERINATGLLGQTVTGMAGEVATESYFLGNPTQGFASFIMPGVLVLILQQSMLLGIAMLGGTSAERRRRNNGYDPLSRDASAVTTVLGRSLCYLVIYLPMSYYVMRMVPYMFALPHVGSEWSYMPIILVMLLATSFMGQAIVVFVRERETCLLVIVFTSLVFLFLSGLTWPRYAMSAFWKCIADCVPATWGVEGAIRVLADGATLEELRSDYLNLWILSGAYFILAVVVTHFLLPRHKDTLAKVPVEI